MTATEAGMITYWYSVPRYQLVPVHYGVQVWRQNHVAKSRIRDCLGPKTQHYPTVGSLTAAFVSVGEASIDDVD